MGKINESEALRAGWARDKRNGRGARKPGKRSTRVPGWKLAGYSLEEYLDGQLKLAADVSKARGTLAGPDPQVVMAFGRWIRRRTLFAGIPYPYSCLVSWFYLEATYALESMQAGDPAWVVVSVAELRRDTSN